MRKGKLILSAVVLVVASSWAASVQAQERSQRKTKVSGIQFFKASSTEASGYQSVTLDDGSKRDLRPLLESVFEMWEDLLGRMGL